MISRKDTWNNQFILNDQSSFDTDLLKMGERPILPLHVCDSMFALEKIADEPIAEKNLDKCIEMLYNLTSEVLNTYAVGDEEMEYISIRKCLKLYKFVSQYKNLKNSNIYKSLCFNHDVIKPRYIELQRSLSKRYEEESAIQHKLLLTSLKKQVPLDPAETTIDMEKVKEIDPDLASFLKVLSEKNSNCLSSQIERERNINIDPFVLGLGRRKIQKELYIAKSLHQLERISRNIGLPQLTFLECIERMCLILSLRQIVRSNDIELDFILLTRYLTLNAKMRKMDEYQENYDDYRNIIVKVVTIKNEYEEVRKLLVERYLILNEGSNLIKRLTKKEEAIKERVEQIRKKKLDWFSKSVKAI